LSAAFKTNGPFVAACRKAGEQARAAGPRRQVPGLFLGQRLGVLVDEVGVHRQRFAGGALLGRTPWLRTGQLGGDVERRLAPLDELVLDHRRGDSGRPVHQLQLTVAVGGLVVQFGPAWTLAAQRLLSVALSGSFERPQSGIDLRAGHCLVRLVVGHRDDHVRAPRFAHERGRVLRRAEVDGIELIPRLAVDGQARADRLEHVDLDVQTARPGGG
jgi:hypothetical protein